MAVGALSLVASYHVRCLAARRWSTLATLLGVALVVAVFCTLLSLADGLRRALLVSADPRNVVVLAEGATAESNSALSNADAANLSALPHLARSPTGRPLVSPEVVVQTSVRRQRDLGGAPASVAVRGIDPEVGLAVHADVRLTAGRWFAPGTDELVVGENAARQFEPGAIGQTLECVGRVFTIVGVFRAGGGAHESEYWGYVSNVKAAYRRDRFSSAVIRLDTERRDEVAQTCERIASASVALRGIGEPAYYGAQAENARLVQTLALAIVIIMSIGAVFAAMNAMYSALAGRAREIGMLRAMGFPARGIEAGLTIESTLVALAGGVLGCVVSAALVLGSGTRDLVGTTTFTSVAFAMRPSLRAIAASLAVSVAIGILGGIWPARKAARMPVTQTLRTA